MYIVELETGVWMAPWPGDPGRVCNIEYAETFDCYQSAIDALGLARIWRPFANAKVIETGDKEMKCKICGSHAINEHLHGRKVGEDMDLCDVCYWRERAKTAYIKGSNDCHDAMKEAQETKK